MFESQNIIQSRGKVSKQQREKFVGHSTLTYWLTGISGAGKTTLAYALEKALYEAGCLCYVLDGDNIRHGLNSNLGFTTADRSENIRRIAEVSKLMNDAGIVVIAAFIAPFFDDREKAKIIIGPEKYVEIYLNTSASVCEKRDSKGLYAKARAGKIQHFTGISSPYEVPKSPHLSIDTNAISVEESVQYVLSFAFPKTV